MRRPASTDARFRIGCDLVDIRRLARLADENPGALDEVLTSRERLYCDSRRRPLQHIAARFAAKEAVLKALGTGLGVGVNWTDVEIVPAPVDGPPEVALRGAAAEYAAASGLAQLEVSLSHVADHAMAVAMAVWRGPSQEQHALPPDRSH